jgi:hypothetical protein
MTTSGVTPSQRDGALARLRTWRAGLALAGVAGVAAAATVAAQTIPGRAEPTSTGAAQVPAGGSVQDGQHQPAFGGDGFQQPSGGVGPGFGRGQALSGGT